MRLHICTVLLACVGCYAYAPVTGVKPLLGNDVRVALTDSGSAALRSSIGPFVTTIDGHLVADSADTYFLNVSRTIGRNGAETDWENERVEVPRAFVRELTMRQFAPARTAVASGIMGGALAILSVAFLHAGGAGGIGSGSAATSHSGR